MPASPGDTVQVQKFVHRATDALYETVVLVAGAAPAAASVAVVVAQVQEAVQSQVSWRLR
ncbi:hypothetical protein [Streptomyces sp. NPDC055287]